MNVRGFLAFAQDRRDDTCRGVAYDCYDWAKDMRTKGTAHNFIAEHWHELSDGDVIDVQFILGETDKPKASERETFPA